MNKRKVLNRQLLATAAALSLALLTGIGPAFAVYPDRPIKVIVGALPGQLSDVVVRLLAQKISDDLRQPVIVDNRPGGAGVVSHLAAKNAAPDGYTLIYGSTGTLAINPSLFRNLPYNPQKDFEPVAKVGTAPLVLFTGASSSINSLKDLIAQAKAAPGKLSYGTPGNGTTAHIAMEMLKLDANIDLLHVPYKGSPPMITDVIGGQVSVSLEPLGSVLNFARSGRLKLIGLATQERAAAAPEVPTLDEQGLKGFSATAWNAILAPIGTPASIVLQLNASINKALKDPEVTALFGKTGSTATGGTVAELRDFLREETQRWSRAVKASGAQVD